MKQDFRDPRRQRFFDEIERCRVRDIREANARSLGFRAARAAECRRDLRFGTPQHIGEDVLDRRALRKPFELLPPIELAKERG
jgi:hypothetical protein